MSSCNHIHQCRRYINPHYSAFSPPPPLTFCVMSAKRHPRKHISRPRNRYDAFLSLTSLGKSASIPKPIISYLKLAQHKRLVNYVKTRLQERSIFSDDSCWTPFQVYFGVTLQDNTPTLGCIPSRSFEVHEKITFPGDEFQSALPLRLTLSYTPPRPKDKIVTGDDHFYCWSLYLSYPSDRRLSKTSALRVRGEFPPLLLHLHFANHYL